MWPQLILAALSLVIAATAPATSPAGFAPRVSYDRAIDVTTVSIDLEERADRLHVFWRAHDQALHACVDHVSRSARGEMVNGAFSVRRWQAKSVARRNGACTVDTAWLRDATDSGAHGRGAIERQERASRDSTERPMTWCD